MGALIYFFPNHADIDVRIESRENRTPAQNGRLHWVGGKHNPTPVYFAGVGIGRLFEGGAYFKFWPIRRRLFGVCVCVRGGEVGVRMINKGISHPGRRVVHNIRTN